MVDLIQIQDKWQKIWTDNASFDAQAKKGKKKFFLTFPYPYVNGLPHVGHLFTIMRVEVFARYKRLTGHNVLFPQAWHCTGSPIVQAAKRVEEGEEKQIKILKDFKIPDSEIKKFADPLHWIEYFPNEYKKDVQKIGLSIDWRREFITTSKNPYYDKFIRWQFLKLKEKGYVIKGKHPVVWDPKTNSTIGDHDRIEGEGETPQEFTLLKYKLCSQDTLQDKEEYLIAATLRPETIYGQTNLWLGAQITYVKAQVNNQIWIISEQCAKKLAEQERDVHILSKIKGEEIIGKEVIAPLINKKILILPSSFCDPLKGTGIVTSVPSDAPDDWMGLSDLQNNQKECEKYKLDFKIISSIKPIPIINSGDLGDMAAVKACTDLKIQNQKQRDLLDKAKKLVYKKGFYEGVMNDTCEEFSRLKVEDAKEKIKQKLLKQGDAELFYELTGKVISRSLTECIVKIVSNQWFLDYGNTEWKIKTHKCLDQLELYPKKSWAQFDYVIDWLRPWACTREAGLGTRLPWDEHLLIESLSDSTIYMAYYTVSHLIKDIEPEKLDENFFDYLFLGKGKKPDIKNIDVMKEEFNYWYPVDFRNSGKDLIQNHLTFYMFNHTAIFDESKWPKGIGVNGWVTVNGQKMSKSLGNVIPVREMAEKFGADPSRITILNGGEGIDDPNWDSEFAKSISSKLIQFHDFCVDNYGKGRKEKISVDAWFESQINSVIKESTNFMDQTMFRSAIQKLFFEFQRSLKWYMKRTNNDPNADLLIKTIEAQIIMLSPFCPHICEEIWQKIGKDYLVSFADWPEYEDNKIDTNANVSELFIQDTIDDIKEVLKIVKIDKPKKIRLFISPAWKYSLYTDVMKAFEDTRNPSEILKSIDSSKYGENMDEIRKLVPKLAQEGIKTRVTSVSLELKFLKDSLKFLKNEFNCDIDMLLGDDAVDAKAKRASPGKVSIIIE